MDSVMKRVIKYDRIELRIEFLSIAQSYRYTNEISLTEPIEYPKGDALTLVKQYWNVELPLLREGKLTLMCINRRGKLLSLVVQCYLPDSKIRCAKIDSVLMEIL